MNIYIDKDYRCHTTDDGTRTAVEVAAFAGKCSEYIESCRYIPAGESWTRSDGRVFSGEMLTLCRPLEELDAVQRAYEKRLLVEYAEVLRILEVDV